MKLAHIAHSTIISCQEFWDWKKTKILKLCLTVPPVCRPGQKTVYSTGRQETAKVVCEVEANPYDITFNWKFNKSHNAMEFVDFPPSHVAVDRLKATAYYTPLTEQVLEFHIYRKSFLRTMSHLSSLVIFTIYLFILVIKFNKIHTFL